MVTNQSSIISQTSIAENISKNSKQLVWETWKLPLQLSLIGFALLFPLIFLSVDLTDPGFALSNQLLVNKLGIKFFEINPVSFLSDVVGGLWLALTANLGLIGAKLGGTLTYSISIGITAKLFQSYFKDKKMLMRAMIAALLVATFALFRLSLMLHLTNYTFPMLLGLLFLYVQISLMKKASYQKSIILGVLLPALFFARYTMILLWIIPLISLFFLKKNEKKQIIIVYAVASITFLCFFISLKTSFSKVLLAISFVFEADLYQNRGIGFFMYFYTYQFLLALKLMGVCALLVLPFFFIKDKNLKIKLITNTLLIILAVVLLASFLPLKLSFISFSPAMRSAILWFKDFNGGGVRFFGAVLIVMVFYVSIYFFRAYKKHQILSPLNKELLFIFLCSLIFVLSFLGSTCGVVKGGYGSWLLIGICTLIASFNETHKAVLNKFMIFISIACLAFLYTHFHADYLGSFSKLAVSKEGKLKGTVTTKIKSQQLSELLAFVHDRTSEKDYVFAYNYIPTIYFLLDRLPITDFPVPEILNQEPLEKMLNKDFAKKVPRLIIKTKFNSYTYDWCKYLSRQNHLEDIHYNKRFASKVAIIENKLNQFYKPKKVWSNNAFDVYEPTIKNE